MANTYLVALAVPRPIAFFIANMPWFFLYPPRGPLLLQAPSIAVVMVLRTVI